MKKVFKLCLIMITILFITGCGGNKYLKKINYKEYHKMLDNKESFVLEIMRTNCSACQNFKPKLEEFVKKYKVKVYYIDTDDLSEKESDKIFNETGISGTPTVIFYENGKEETKSSRINGSVSTEKIIEKFKANGIIKE